MAKQVMIVELRGKTEVRRETVNVAHLHPMQLPDFLGSQGVSTVIAGGVDRYLQELLRLRNIEVIWGINGNVDEVMAVHLRNGLQLGMGLCPPPRGRRRRRFRGVHI